MRDLLGAAEATGTAGDGKAERVDVARSPRLDLAALRARLSPHSTDCSCERCRDLMTVTVPALIAELAAARPAAALLVRAREALSEIVTLCVDPEDKRVDLAKNLVLACGIAKEALVAIGSSPEGQVSNG